MKIVCAIFSTVSEEEQKEHSQVCGVNNQFPLTNTLKFEFESHPITAN